LSLAEFAVERTKCEVAVLIRNREGGFVYNAEDIKLMANEIRRFADKGVNAVVVGALTPDGDIDVEALRLFKKAALRGKVELAFHRAFDVCRNPLEALSILEQEGVSRLLTSGQHATCVEGKENLLLYARQVSDLRIMPGSGLRASNIHHFDKKHFHDFHASASVIRNAHSSAVIHEGFVDVNEDEVKALAHAVFSV
jgi:copper homeostasis protein